jgi:hypothetical protein
MNRKPRFLKTNYKPPKRPALDGRLDLYNPFTHKNELLVTKKIEKHVKKQNKKYELSGSDSESDSSDDSDHFRPTINDPPKRKAMLPKKEQPKFDGLKIIGLDSTKNMTEQRPAMEKNIIPRHPSINMVLGSIGSGKTVMCVNMLLNPHMYGKDKTGRPYYDEIFLFTNSSDDIMQKLIDDGIIPKDHVKHHPEEKHLKAVIKKQKEKVKEANGDWGKVPRIFIILDDIIDCDIVKSNTFKSLCSRPRQINCSVFVLSQYYFSLPKICRQNATNIFCFSGNVQDKEALADTFTPPSLNKKEFGDILGFCWTKDEKYSHPFIHIDRRQPEESRFRKCLLDVIDIDSFKKN